MNEMRIQFFSDIHLEFGPCELINAEADVLVAAGDISIGTTALKWLEQATCPVIYIAGNHEYYSGDIVHTLNELRIQSKVHDIHFLENNSITINDVRFLGATLWTDFDNKNKDIMEYAAVSMNDYNYIGCDGYVLTPEDILKTHEQSKKWLAKELDDQFKGKTVVVTHHAPSIRSWHGEYDSMHLYNYCNKYEEYIEHYDIDLWIHGHIHANSDYSINKTRVVCNPRGYCDHQFVDGYAINKTIEI